jgi:hypothetical protein
VGATEIPHTPALQVFLDQLVHALLNAAPSPGGSPTGIRIH